MEFKTSFRSPAKVLDQIFCPDCPTFARYISALDWSNSITGSYSTRNPMSHLVPPPVWPLRLTITSKDKDLFPASAPFPNSIISILPGWPLFFLWLPPFVFAITECCSPFCIVIVFPAFAGLPYIFSYIITPPWRMENKSGSLIGHWVKVILPEKCFKFTVVISSSGPPDAVEEPDSKGFVVWVICSLLFPPMSHPLSVVGMTSFIEFSKVFSQSLAK